MWGFDDMDLRVAFVRGESPRDFATLLARWIVFRTTNLLAVLLYPVDYVVRLIGRITPVEFLFLFTLFWLPMWALLTGTSWLWMRSAQARPLLLVPGMIIAVFSFVYLMMVPDSKKGYRYPAMAGEWPLTWDLWRPSWEYKKDNDYFEGPEYVGGLDEWHVRLKEKADRLGPNWAGPLALRDDPQTKALLSKKLAAELNQALESGELALKCSRCKGTALKYLEEYDVFQCLSEECGEYMRRFPGGA